jgi:pilus assembly protein CpaB
MKLTLPSIPKLGKTWAVLGVALVIGGVAALTTRSYLSQKIEAIELRGKFETVDLLVAKSLITKGSIVAVDDLAIRKIPVEFAHSGAVAPQDVLSVAGRVSNYDLKQGEMLLSSQLLSKRPATFSARLEHGQRAITVMVDEINSISGMLEPGDLIDLIFTADQNGKKIILPLLQRVQVMATGKRSVDDPHGGEAVQFATVTLNTTPDEAKNIILARETGKLTALLRSPGDDAGGARGGVDLATWFGPHPSSQSMARDNGVPVLYGGTGGTFPAEALRLGRYRGAAKPSDQLPAFMAPPMLPTPTSQRITTAMSQ